MEIIVNKNDNTVVNYGNVTTNKFTISIGTNHYSTDSFVSIHVDGVPEDIQKKQYKFINNAYIIYEASNTKSILTKAEFFGRFTFEEQNALVNYEIVIDSQDIDETEKAQRKMAMKTLWKLLDNLTEIDLNYNDILNPFAQIVSNCGLVTIDRIIEILEPMTVIF